MKTSIHCIPCLVRQVLEASGFYIDDDDFRAQIMRETLNIIAGADLSQPPPVIAQQVYRYLRNKHEIHDPYEEIKNRFNTFCLSMLGPLKQAVSSSQDPLLQAVKIAIAGNGIDCGAKTGLTVADVEEELESTMDHPVQGDYDAFRHAAERAKSILYIADNAGEIVFDRLLIEQLGPERVTLVVRGAPVINDATLADAQAVGLNDIVTVIDNGSDAPGTILNECSGQFQSLFNSSDMVIAKGQGNYETLGSSPREVFFLFKVKCSLVADHSGYPGGTHAIVKRGPVQHEKYTGTSNETKPEINQVIYSPIGIIHSEHKVADATPIQPVYAADCEGRVEVFPEFEEGLQDIEGFSHIYLIFHLHKAGPARLKVVPFLDVTERGVFATRAPVRPNAIGMSIVELIKCEGNILFIRGTDMLDGTPLLDIKPYAGRFDCIESTRNGWQDDIDEDAVQRRGRRNFKGSNSRD